jgi:hypothetical protein
MTAKLFSLGMLAIFILQFAGGCVIDPVDGLFDSDGGLFDLDGGWSAVRDCELPDGTMWCENNQPKECIYSLYKIDGVHSSSIEAGESCSYNNAECVELSATEAACKLSDELCPGDDESICVDDIMEVSCRPEGQFLVENCEADGKLCEEDWLWGPQCVDTE